VKIPVHIAAGVAAASILTQAPVWAEGMTLEQVVEAAKPIIDLRLRSETVRQTGIAQDARAVTLRGRLGFETGKLWDTQLLAEAELVWPLSADYNSTINGKTQYPIVADPEDYALNRLQLTNTSIPGTTLVLGRQRMNLDDQRFIGASGWRQNEQTFDALRVTNHSLRNLTVDLAYIDQVNRVFGEESPVGIYRGSTYFANVSYQTAPGKLTAFAYLLDLNKAPTDSSSTVGLRFAGEHAFKGIKYGYAAAYGTQREYADNPLNYRDDYFAVELAATLREFSLTGGIEVLQGDGTKGFTAPLGTLHKFQGWADKFLTTPANGIDDSYLALGYAKKSLGVFDSFALIASAHKFKSDRLAIDYGKEFDLQAQLKRRGYTLLLKYADYSADAFATDTRKFWVELDYLR
jgi:hypothetical protein